MDVDRFEACCARCANTGLEEEERLSAGEEALNLYQGEFMAKMGRQMWVIPTAVRLHNLYLETVKTCAALLEQRGE